jgi:hypothetical protein
MAARWGVRLTLRGKATMMGRAILKTLMNQAVMMPRVAPKTTI